MRLIVAAALLVAAEAFSPSFLATRGPAPARLKRSAWHMTATAPEPTEVLEAPAVERKSPKFTSTIFREPEVGASKNRAYVLDRELAGQKRDGRKTVIITGASGGIGLQAAKSLALDVRPGPSNPCCRPSLCCCFFRLSHLDASSHRRPGSQHRCGAIALISSQTNCRTPLACTQSLNGVVNPSADELRAG
jgi:hypothetical protein